MAGLRLWTADAPGTMDWWYMGACAGEDTELFFHPENERGSAKKLREAAAQAVRCTSSVVIGRSEEERGLGYTVA